MSQTTLVQDSAANGTGGAAVRPIAVPTQPARPTGPSIINKVGVSGQPINIAQLTNVNPDCTAGTVGLIKITQQPAHGKAVVEDKDIYPNFPSTNMHATCNSQKFPGLVVSYTSAPGFTGSDLMAIEVFTRSGGDSNEIKVLVTVK